MDPNMQNLHHKTSYKRKRDTPDSNGNKRQANQRPSSSSNNVHGNGHAVNHSHDIFSNDSSSNDFARIGQQIQAHIANADPSTAAAALAANMPQLTVPRPTELSFPSTGSGNDPDRQLDSSFDMGGGSDGDHHHHNHNQGPPYNLDAYQGDPVGQAQTSDGGGGTKPAVGTDEWHKVRRDNHKEVERRRRETINEGINELAKIVPNCEKNKGSILQRGVQYITQLKDNEKRNIEKWTLEKLLTDQAIAELSSSVERLKNDLNRAYREVERWKKTCQEAGLEPKDDSGTDDDGDA
ncbi:hypothetical protein OEA41_008744 [Lepraria neglecta]|uniref:BHLH domain-containing protein n=1 Tax=Lepraria neglecta TaxID=209136 RepID=A0AAE0DH26_9LECA|nr:hypothetical protein OEA41_008744 [Lepraria neglecta]